MVSRVKRLSFYATGEDLAAVTSAVEQAIAVRYVLTGNFTRRPNIEHASAVEFPDFGHARYDTAIACDAYLVLPRSQPLEVRELEGDFRIRRYLVDQLENAGTVILRPGGLHGRDVLIEGQVSTTHDDDDARSIMRAYKREFRSRFVTVDSRWVGPQAAEMLDSGKRLTVDARHDWHDLRRPG